MGQCKIEGGALVQSAFGPDASTVTVEDALNDRQPDAGAGEFLFAMEALEHAKELVGVLHVESCAIVAYGVNDLLRTLLAADTDDRTVALAGELGGVGNKVSPNLTHQRGIA